MLFIGMKKPDSKQRPWSSKKSYSRPMQTREKSNDLYHTSRWTKESKRFRQQYPCCLHCAQQEDLIVPSEVVDHIIPLSLCSDPWDKSNWQALCKRHNNIKAAQDKKLIKQHKL
jgi:5-methylcytosine-specific restriction protein A